MELFDLEFCGGPACGKRERVGAVKEGYTHYLHGQVYEYVTEHEPRRGKWVTVHTGRVEVA